MIDIKLLRLRYEILNVPLVDLAEEVEIPLSTLEKEARSKNWSQWWPTVESNLNQTNNNSSTTTNISDLSPADAAAIDSSQAAPSSNSSNVSPDVPSGIPTLPSLNESLFDEEQLSPLEEGAQLYINETRIRLQVFNLAKEVYLAHKYAVLEATLIDEAKRTIETEASSQALLQLSSMVKNLSTRANSSQFSIGQDEDGLPTVIIRDLTGKQAS